MAIISQLYRDKEVPEADVDGNKEINISDLVYFVSYIFKNGNEPVACL